MYSVNLAGITVEEFEKIMLTTQLLPSQKLILEGISHNTRKLKDKGLTNLQEVHDLLGKKQNYPAISKDMGIDGDYLVILNRMVNSYIAKVLPLGKLGIFTKEELELLEKEKINNTKQYYEALLSTGQKEELSARTCISLSRIGYALHITDLLRINGVGVDYARILYETGVKGIGDYNRTTSETILRSVNELNRERAFSKATLGISDIDYCRRFCEKLDDEISYL